VFLQALQASDRKHHTLLETVSQHCLSCMAHASSQCVCTLGGIHTPLSLDVPGLPFQMRMVITPVYVLEVRCIKFTHPSQKLMQHCGPLLWLMPGKQACRISCP
jgi:hypothetical protein